MKLFEIKDLYADDPDYIPDPEHKKEAIKYMWNQLYAKWEQQHPGSLERQKAKDKLIKREHLWAKVPRCAFVYNRHILGVDILDIFRQWFVDNPTSTRRDFINWAQNIAYLSPIAAATYYQKIIQDFYHLDE